MKERIQEELRKLEENTPGLKVLYAAESGSRAWGFESEDSDYDVRFIYRFPKKEYLRLNEPRSSISWFSEDRKLDFSGWDIKKAMGLARKSNPSFIEWLKSPIVYRDCIPERAQNGSNRDISRNQEVSHGRTQEGSTSFREIMSRVMEEHFCPSTLMFHYASFASNIRGRVINWNIEETEGILLKDFFYVLRPMLCFNFVEKYYSLPPMKIDDLYCVVGNLDLEDKIRHLVIEKRLGKERDSSASVRVDVELVRMVDSWMAECFGRAQKAPKIGMSNHLWDDLFQRFLEF